MSKKHVLETPLERKQAELRDGLCLASENHGEVCTIREDRKCVVMTEPKECPAIKDEKAVERKIYGF